MIISDHWRNALGLDSTKSPFTDERSTESLNIKEFEENEKEENNTKNESSAIIFACARILDVSYTWDPPSLEDVDDWMRSIGYKTLAKDSQSMRLTLHDETTELNFEFLVFQTKTFESQNICCIEWKFVLDNMFGGKCGFIISLNLLRKEYKAQVGLRKKITCPDSIWFQRTVEQRLENLADNIIELFEDKIRQKVELILKKSRRLTYWKIFAVSICFVFASSIIKHSVFFGRPKICLSIKELDVMQLQAKENILSLMKIQANEIEKSLNDIKKALD